MHSHGLWGERPMQCPRCDIELKTIDYEGVKIEMCPGCNGQGLDAGELRHIVDARDVRFDDEERRAIGPAYSMEPSEVAGAGHGLTCPKCTGLMKTLNYGGDTGIMVDRCGCGGVWLDAGELDRIQMLVERWQDELPEELRRHGPQLCRIAADVNERAKVSVSRFGFVNAIIKGILNVLD